MEENVCWYEEKDESGNNVNVNNLAYEASSLMPNDATKELSQPKQNTRREGRFATNVNYEEFQAMKELITTLNEKVTELNSSAREIEMLSKENTELKEANKMLTQELETLKGRAKKKTTTKLKPRNVAAEERKIQKRIQPAIEPKRLVAKLHLKTNLDKEAEKLKRVDVYRRINIMLNPSVYAKL